LFLSNSSVLSSHHSVPKIAIKLRARFNELCSQMSKIDPCKDLPNLNHRRILGHTGDESMRPARRKSAAYFMWHECHALYSPRGGPQEFQESPCAFDNQEKTFISPKGKNLSFRGLCTTQSFGFSQMKQDTPMPYTTIHKPKNGTSEALGEVLCWCWASKVDSRRQHC